MAGAVLSFSVSQRAARGSAGYAAHATRRQFLRLIPPNNLTWPRVPRMIRCKQVCDATAMGIRCVTVGLFIMLWS